MIALAPDTSVERTLYRGRLRCRSLSKFGFADMVWADLPPALSASAGLPGACPVTATASGRKVN